MIDMNNLFSVILFIRECRGPDFMLFRIHLLTRLLAFHQTITPYIMCGIEAKKRRLHSHGNFYTNT